MTKDIDVLGIGNAIMDIIAPVPDAFLAANKIERGSMTLVDELRALDLNAALSGVGELREIAGGSAANTMVGIAELGIRAAYVGKVGHDDVGKRLIAGYRDAGVQFETAPTSKTTASARCMIAVTPDGQRSMSTYLGANADFGTADISKAQIARAASDVTAQGFANWLSIKRISYSPMKTNYSLCLKQTASTQHLTLWLACALSHVSRAVRKALSSRLIRGVISFPQPRLKRLSIQRVQAINMRRAFWPDAPWDWTGPMRAIWAPSRRQKLSNIMARDRKHRFTIWLPIIGKGFDRGALRRFGPCEIVI